MSSYAAADSTPTGRGAQPRSRPVLPMREDLHLYPGPRTQEGAQTWTLHDRARNRYFKMGWLEFEILRRWKRGNVEAIAAGVTAETALECRPADVLALQAFLDQNQLVRRVGMSQVERLVQLRERMRSMRRRVRTQRLLFLRFPLFKPDRFLTATLPYVRFVYTQSFILFVALVAVTGLVLAGRQWESFVHTFQYAFTLEGMLLFGVAIFVTKAIHELGHAYTAKYLGLRVPTIGIALLILWPVFYTDTTDSWRLRSHRQRLLIGVAGVAAELMLAAFATLIWSFLPDGPLRSVMFFIAAVSWVLTLIVNLNPFLRWDGYYVLSDLLGVENLQPRSFALAKWWLRGRLWGLDDDPPEQFPARRRKTLILYAVATWLYRLLLFATISVLVYEFLFKILGLLMLVVVMNAFILRPVFQEVSQWWKRRADIRLGRRILVLGTFFGLMGLLLFYPWRTTLDAPAVWRPAEFARVYAPAASRIADIRVENGDQVEPGQLLFRLELPTLEHEQQLTEADIEMLRAQIARRGASEAYLERSQVLEQQLAEALARYRGNQRELARLEVYSPMAGQVTDIPETVRSGRWIPASFLFGAVIGGSGAEVVAYVSESDLSRLTRDAAGRFYADDPEAAPFPVRVREIDRANVAVLEEPYSASVYGGGIAVAINENDQLAVHESLYRVRLAPEDGTLPPRVTRGSVRLSVASENLVSRVWRLVSAVFIRESGF
jgi:putative peptide zinc metalloprotease protein